MHELPRDLTKSLRSWRGSTYSDPRHKDEDLEKGPEDYGDKIKDDSFNATQTSLVPHPTRSSQALRQAWQQKDRHQYREQDPYGLRPQEPQRQDAQGQIDPESIVPKKQATFPPQTPASAKRSLFTAPRIADPDPAADRLDDNMTPLSKEDFYELIGMRQPASKSQPPKQLAIPHGLYGTIQSRMRYIQTKYRIFDVCTYVFLALQILLSAVFIVLGTLPQVDSHVAIAVLGAVSVVIAGILALMKGQGLPNRLRQVRDSLRNVLFEAEELYWDVAADRPVLYKDIKKVREDYLRVMEEARRNHPDTWNQSSSKIADGVGTHVKTKAPAAVKTG